MPPDLKPFVYLIFTHPLGLNQTSHPVPVVQELKEAAENLRSSFEIEKNKNEEVLDEINHVNVGDIKKEPTDQDTSEESF